MQKINEIWLPDEDVQISTDGLKQWIKFCKYQYKKFQQVLDCNSEYGIWSRSMRLYAKEIFAFEHRKSFAKFSEKNLVPYNNVKYNDQQIADITSPPKTFNIDYFNYTNLDLIKINSNNVITTFSGAPKTLGKNDENQSNVKFLYIENITNDVDAFINSLKYKCILDNLPDRVYYK
ncbi:MAG: hypothetical protein CBB97_13410 [Candidatus Endolissoclinum sp. TMED37]|nr:MAG: hypothetical protein CBB97_13410 [Candidatus Endolissoclinum sp. TMED37]|tara:strand:+ start:1663 stop:2190 length:528 start_codon:yes stop_codon:yes gene_type:complete